MTRARTLENGSAWGPWTYHEDRGIQFVFHGKGCERGCERVGRICARCGPPKTTKPKAGTTNYTRADVCRQGCKEFVGGECERCGDGYAVVITQRSSDNSSLLRWREHVARKPWATPEAIAELHAALEHFGKRRKAA